MAPALWFTVNINDLPVIERCVQIMQQSGDPEYTVPLIRSWMHQGVTLFYYLGVGYELVWAYRYNRRHQRWYLTTINHIQGALTAADGAARFVDKFLEFFTAHAEAPLYAVFLRNEPFPWSVQLQNALLADARIRATLADETEDQLFWRLEPAGP